MVRSHPIVKMQWDAVNGTWIRRVIAVGAIESNTAMMEQRELDRIADNAADEIAAMEQSWLAARNKCKARRRLYIASEIAISFTIAVLLTLVIVFVAIKVHG